MRNLSIKFVLALAIGGMLAFTLTPPRGATAMTRDGFNNQNSKPQKSPQRQLAKRIAPPQQESEKNKQLQKQSDKNSAGKKADITKPEGKADKHPPQPVSKERKVELMAFVKANHPELLSLLNQLQSKRRHQFHSALRTLDKNVKHLQSVEKQSAGRYQHSLNIWKVSSRIHLLTAQLAIKKSDKEKASLAF